MHSLDFSLAPAPEQKDAAVSAWHSQGKFLIHLKYIPPRVIVPIPCPPLPGILLRLSGFVAPG